MDELVLSAASFWRGKRVLVTGHTGFKGSWLTLWLESLGAQVTGIALPPKTTLNLFTAANVASHCASRLCDVRDAVPFADQVHAATPQIVFHLAAQPLVRASYRDPVATYETNVMGTAHLLEALRKVTDVRVAVMVTTDKVYRVSGDPLPHGEDDALGGFDPYSASKAASEHVIASYRDAFLSSQGVAVASARAGNVIGGGDWSEDRLLPDAVRAWQDGSVLDVRRPYAVRPWQHVLEPLAGYLSLAEALWRQPSMAGAYNFGPDMSEAATVRTVVEIARSAYGRGDVLYGEDMSGPHETALLTLNNAKAKKQLGVMPVFTLSEAVSRTMAWYRTFAEGIGAHQLCSAEIADFERRRSSGGQAQTASA
ncbi:MAG: CDP-glucose 4,6-dehydratase [Pseudolabrys sp.]|nr:CDP-glucose 4,6-dehydratase [Pseudolabrys sp.]